jgi:hypothetical protein
MFKQIKAYFAKPIIEPQGPTPMIGDVIPVGEHFWINDDVFIGLAPHATHGHDSDTGIGHQAFGADTGSADVNCTVTIIDHVGTTHVVAQLGRKKMPYGAQAAIGTVFYLSIKQLNSWGPKRTSSQEVSEKRTKLMKTYFR